MQMARLIIYGSAAVSASFGMYFMCNKNWHNSSITLAISTALMGVGSLLPI